jgi:hypothetical protein
MNFRNFALIAVVLAVVTALGGLLWKADQQRKISQLREAIRHGDREGVIALVQSHRGLLSADLGEPHRETRRCPLSLAAGLGKYEIAVELVRLGADVNARDKYSETPLHGAVRGGDPRIVELLLKNHADIEARNVRGDTALDHAEHAGSSEEMSEKLKRILHEASKAGTSQGN